MEFKIERYNGKIIGFSLIPPFENSQEFFCNQFTRALLRSSDEASIDIGNERVKFEISNAYIKDFYSFAISAEDAEILGNILSLENEYKNKQLEILNAGTLQLGFKIILRGEEYTKRKNL